MGTANYRSDYTEGDTPQLEMEALTRGTDGVLKVIDITGFTIKLKFWHPDVLATESAATIIDGILGLAKFVFTTGLPAGYLYYEWLITDSGTPVVSVTSKVRFRKYVKVKKAVA